LKNLLISFLATIIFFGILEGLAYWYGFRKQGWDYLDSELGWKMKYPTENFTENPSEAKIVILGDSIAYGNINSGKSISQVLENKGFPSVNLSAIGYGTDQEFLYLKRFSSKIPKVKLIVLSFCLFNDFLDNGSPVNPFDGLRTKPYFELENNQLVIRKEHFNYRSIDYTTYYLRQHSGTVYFMVRAFQILKILPSKYPERLKLSWWLNEPGPDAQTWKKYLKRRDKGFPITKPILQEMNKFIKEKWNADFLILLHPFSYYPDGRDPLLLDESMVQYFGSMDMNIFDLGCFFKSRKLAFADIAYDRMGHLVSESEAMIAEWIGRYFQNSLTQEQCFVSRPDSSRTDSSRQPERWTKRDINP